jgi:hypothetical protein
VQRRSQSFAALAVLALAVALSGCASSAVDLSQPWFTRPFDVVGKNGGYTFSELQETKQRQRPITASDLVNSNGTCPPQAAPAPTAAAGPGAIPTAPAAPPDAAASTGGVALGMSECDVVFRAGPPTTVTLGANPNGDRTAVLTYSSGPRSGIYRFERGELVQMDRVAAQDAPPPPVKKKPAKSAKSSKPQSQS